MAEGGRRSSSNSKLPEFTDSVMRNLDKVDFSPLAHHHDTDLIDVCRRNAGLFLQTQEILLLRNSYDERFLALRKTNRQDLETLKKLAAPSVDLFVHQRPRNITLDELFQQANHSKVEFLQLLSLLSLKVSEALTRVVSINSGPMKERDRAQYKVDNDYNGQACRLVDILRASCVCPTVSDLCEAVAAVLRSSKDDDLEGHMIVKIKSGFHGDYTSGGYRDVKALIRMRDSGHIVEIQFQLEEFNRLRKAGGHAAYKWSRMVKITSEMSGFHLIPPEDQGNRELLALLEIAEANPFLDWLRGVLYTRLRLDARAVAFYRHLVNTLQPALGEDNHIVITNYSNLGLALYHEGQYLEAERWLRKAVKAAAQTFGPAHTDTLTSYSLLSACLQVQGKYSEAEEWIRKAIEGRVANLGSSHPDTLNIFNQLAGCLQLQGKLPEAAKWHRKALEGCILAMGEASDETLNCYNGLGTCLQAQGKFEEAEALHRQSLAGRSRKLGEEHPDTLVSCNNLALSLNSQEKVVEAEALLRRAWESSVKKRGELHPETLGFSNNLASVLSKQRGKLTEAIERHLTVLSKTGTGSWTDKSRHSVQLQQPGDLSEFPRGAYTSRNLLPESPSWLRQYIWRNGPGNANHVLQSGRLFGLATQIQGSRGIACQGSDRQA